ncbi:MAG TPA: hypothetical protein VEA99_18365 [Gemmatimonadaceae bacterium]|nr:hypothetical protein [Gemmatimonadaceae bacterium]
MSRLHRAARRLHAVPTILTAALLAAGCTATGSTFGSGVGDAFLERPPYYAGATVAPDVRAIAHLPIGWQRGASDLPLFEPASDQGSAVAALLAEMNAYLDSLGASRRVAVDAASPLPAGTPPDVRFGCTELPGDDCEGEKEAERGLFNRRGPRMRLAVGRPSTGWTSGAARSIERSGASHLLVLSLEAGQYFLRQQGWQGRKVVELGTDHTVSQPWLTAIDRPVQVIQLTGALMDRDGKAVRIGAEGLFAKRTGLVMSSLGMHALVTEDDVKALRTARRDDLPGRPLVWQVALRTLVEGLVVRAGTAD